MGLQRVWPEELLLLDWTERNNMYIYDIITFLIITFRAGLKSVEHSKQDVSARSVLVKHGDPTCVSSCVSPEKST